MSEDRIAIPGIAKLTLSGRTTKKVRNRAGSIASAVNFIGPPIITRDEIAGEDCAGWFLTRHAALRLVLRLLHRGTMMKRLLVLMVVGAAQQGPANEWTSMSHQAKITFANGINVGVAATLHMENGGKSVDPNADLVKELDEFYKANQIGESRWRTLWRIP
jgi:hypothetical protein